MRRDARKLAELLRAGLLTEVRPPTPAEEAVRDLCRARDDAREDLQRCRHRLGKLLLRRGLHYSGRNWTQAHRRWIDEPGVGATGRARRRGRLSVGDRSLEARLHRTRRAAGRDRRDASRIANAVGWLRCFRGIDTLTAMLILAELHDFRRFQSPRALMAYLGLVPGEDSSGEKHRRGRITRTGNALVRRLLVETAWHYQHRPGVGVALDAAPQRATGPGHRDRGQGAAATVSTIPTPGGTTQAGAEDRGGDRARAGGLPVGGAPTGPGELSDACDGRRASVRRPGSRAGDGPRRRRMIRGTIVRIGELAMRYGHPSQLAPLDCTSSRRSTVMCALPRATAVTTVYQRDSSSKRPRSSVVSAARAPTRGSPLASATTGWTISG